MTLYMFRTVFPSIVRSSILYIQQPNRYCCLLASKQAAVSVWHMPIAVCTVLNSWWWTERPSGTCRVSFQNKIILYTGACSWFYYRNSVEKSLHDAEVQLQSSATSVVEGGRWSVQRRGCSPPPPETPRSSNGPRGRSGRAQKTSPPLEVDPRVGQPAAAAMPSMLSRSP